ncbi:MAG: DNA recombination protein RmuC, partial [Clostridia bacterium]|nr:DNA recombination protein RmuC [Clostridia bacterium]
MNDILACILIALVFVCVILLIILLLKSGKDGGVSSLIHDEFSRSRAESAAEQRSQREELASSLDAMGRKISDFESGNRDAAQHLTAAISESLDGIRVSSLEQNKSQLQYVVGMMERMQADNEKRLEQMRETVDEKLSVTLRTRLDLSFRSVSEQLEKVYISLGEMKTLSTGVTENVTSLNRILTNVKARGTWAEVQLDGILSQTIPGMYEKNVHTVPGSRDVVEFAVKIPSGGDADNFAYLPIDSKFPLEDYVRLCDAADNGDGQAVAEFLEQHPKIVKV